MLIKFCVNRDGHSIVINQIIGKQNDFQGESIAVVGHAEDKQKIETNQALRRDFGQFVGCEARAGHEVQVQIELWTEDLVDLVEVFLESLRNESRIPIRSYEKL